MNCFGLFNVFPMDFAHGPASTFPRLEHFSVHLGVTINHSSFKTFHNPSSVVALQRKRRSFKWPNKNKSMGLMSGDFVGMSSLQIWLGPPASLRSRR